MGESIIPVDMGVVDSYHTYTLMLKEGVSIVEVTYDAIEITGSANYSGIYGAIDPTRKGFFVVNIGGYYAAGNNQ